MAYASVNDVAARINRSLSDTEIGMCGTMLDDAAVIIDGKESGAYLLSEDVESVIETEHGKNVNRDIHDAVSEAENSAMCDFSDEEKKPYTTEGIPASSDTAGRMIFTIFFEAKRDMKIAVSSPAGTPTISAPAVT